jgi:hypothetical protein
MRLSGLVGRHANQALLKWMSAQGGLTQSSWNLELLDQAAIRTDIVRDRGQSIVPWILFGVAVISSGCGQRSGAARFPAAGMVSLSTGEKPTGSITFVPVAGHSGPAATTTLVDGHYQFDRSNGPTAGPHWAIVQRSVSKDTVLASRGERRSTESKGAALRNPKMEWTSFINVPQQGSYQCDLSLDP